MTRLCSARRQDRAMGVACILYDEVGGSPPRRDTRFVGNMEPHSLKVRSARRARSSEARDYRELSRS
jgi:hypothetical protein